MQQLIPKHKFHKPSQIIIHSFFVIIITNVLIYKCQYQLTNSKENFFMTNKKQKISKNVGKFIIKELTNLIPQNTPLKQIAKKTGYTEAYLSQITNFARIPEKYEVYETILNKGLGIAKADIEDKVMEAKLTDAGIADPAITLMLKEIPHMTNHEKQSILDAFELVKTRRQKKFRI